MASDYTIRKTTGKSLTPEQVKRLSELCRQLDDAEQGYEQESGLHVRKPDRKFLGKWLKSRDGIVHADDSSGNIVGFSSAGRAWDHPNAGYVGSLVVDRDHRGNGIGSAILDRIIRDNRRKRLKTILTVSLGNKAGLSLYRSRGFKPFRQSMVLSEKTAEIGKEAAPLPMSRVKFRTIRQWVNQLMRATKGITPTAVRDPDLAYMRDKKLDTVVGDFVARNGIANNFRTFRRLKEAEPPTLRAEATIRDGGIPNLSVSPVDSAAARALMFPRRAVYRGTLGVGGTPGNASDPSNASGALDIPGGRAQYAHVTSGPEYAERYGLLNVFNARRVPGLLNGRLQWFGNRGAAGAANSDLTAVRGLYYPGRYTYSSKNPIARRLDTHSSDFETGHGDKYVETLVDTRHVHPSRVYTHSFGTGSYTDITPLDMYRRTLYGPSKLNPRRRAIVDSLVRVLRPKTEPLSDSYYPGTADAVKRLTEAGWDASSIEKILPRIEQLRSKMQSNL